MLTEITVGSARRFGVRFSVDGVPTNPDTVTLTVQAPGGAQTVYAGADLENPEPGVYKRVILLDAPGSWYLRWQGTGAAYVAKEQQVNVARSMLRGVPA